MFVIKTEFDENFWTIGHLNSYSETFFEDKFKILFFINISLVNSQPKSSSINNDRQIKWQEQILLQVFKDNIQSRKIKR